MVKSGDGNQLELDIGLDGRGEEVLVEFVVLDIRRVDPGKRVGVNLLAQGVGELVPGAGAEDTPLGGIAEGRDFAAASILVQLIDAGRLLVELDPPGWSVPPTASSIVEVMHRVGDQIVVGGVLVVLVVGVAVGVGLGIELPALAEVVVEGNDVEERLARDRPSSARTARCWGCCPRFTALSS